MTATRQIQFTSQEQLFASRLNQALDEVANILDDGPGISVRGFMQPEDGSDIGPALRRIRDQGYLSADRRNTIVIPAGNWVAGSVDTLGVGYALRLDGFSNFAIRGAGVEQTIITAAPGTDLGFMNLLNAENVEISDFTFDGNRANQAIVNPTRPNKHGIRCSSLSNVRIKRLSLLNVQAYGIGLQSGNFADLLLQDILVDGCGMDGFDLKNPLASNRNVLVSRCHVRNMGMATPTVGKAGIDVRGPARVEFCTVEISTAIGTPNNHAYFRARPDSSGAIFYANANILPEEGDIVTGLSSGATAEVSAVSGSSVLSSGGIGLTEIVGAFTNGEAITLSGGKTATCTTYTPPADNGGSGAVFAFCTAIGPTDGNVSTAFAILDDDVALICPRSTNVQNGVYAASGGQRLTVFSPFFDVCEYGFDLRVSNVRIFGGMVRGATQSGVVTFDGDDVVVHGVHFVDCLRGVQRNNLSSGARLLDLVFTDVPTPYANFTMGDQRATHPHVAERAGIVVSVLPTPSYSSTAALVGGAGGAANSTIYFYPLPIYSRVSLLRFGVISGAAVVGVSAKMALYRDLGETPGNDGVNSFENLIVEAPGSMSLNVAANTQTRVTLSAAVTLEPGLYWLALKANGAGRPYTVPETGPVGEWARFVGVANAASLFAGTGGAIRVASTALVDYDAPFPAACPVVTFGTSGTGSPFMFAQTG